MPRSRTPKPTPVRSKAAQNVLDEIAKVVDSYGRAVSHREAAEAALAQAYRAEDHARDEASKNAIVSPAVLAALTSSPRKFTPATESAGQAQEEEHASVEGSVE